MWEVSAVFVVMKICHFCSEKPLIDAVGSACHLGYVEWIKCVHGLILGCTPITTLFKPDTSPRMNSVHVKDEQIFNGLISV